MSFDITLQLTAAFYIFWLGLMTPVLFILAGFRKIL